MNIPSLPTDNLYKFIALSGLLIFIVVHYYCLTQAYELDKQKTILSGEISKIELETNSIKEKQRHLKYAIEELYLMAGIKDPITVTDTLIIYSRYLSGPKEFISKSKEVEQKVEQFNQTQQDYLSKKFDLDTKRSIQKFNENTYSQLFEVYPFVSVISFAISLVGFILWYKKIQRFQDIILQKEYHEQVSKIHICQSCGIKLDDVPQYGGTELDGNLSSKYCTQCYQNGQFTEPNLTINEMQEKVKKQLKKLKVPFIKRTIHISQLSELQRWSKELKW